MNQSNDQMRSWPRDLIAFKWAETLSTGEQSVLLASSLKRLQQAIGLHLAQPRKYHCSCGGALTADEYLHHYFELKHDRGDLAQPDAQRIAEIRERLARGPSNPNRTRTDLLYLLSCLDEPSTMTLCMISGYNHPLGSNPLCSGCRVYVRENSAEQLRECLACSGKGKQLKPSGDPRKPIGGTVECSICDGWGFFSTTSEKRCVKWKPVDVTQQHDFIQIVGSDRCGLRGCVLGVLEHAWIPPLPPSQTAEAQDYVNRDTGELCQHLNAVPCIPNYEGDCTFSCADCGYGT